MKKILVILIALSFICLPSFAEEGDHDGYIIKYNNSDKLHVVEEVPVMLFGFDSDIEYIEPNYYCELFGSLPTVNLPYTEGNNWNLEDINVSPMWESGVYGDGVTVAVLDSGIDVDESLSASVISAESCVSGEVSSNGGDITGHGTYVAKIIASQWGEKTLAGIAPNVKIKGYKCFRKVDGKARASSADIVSAINKAVADGCRILNMSFGSASESYSILDAVNDAASKGVLMFAAAGNDGNDTINYPAGYSKVTGVGSTSKGKTRSSFSNYNSSVFVVAPGGAVPVDVEVKVSGDWSVTRLSGTSFSTPTVAAVAALCLSMNKNLDTASFQELLKNTSTDLGDTGWDNYYGYGIINGEKLFKSLFAVPSKEDANGKTEYTVYIEGITEGDKGIMLFKSDKGVNAGGFTAKDGMVTATFSCKVTVPETVFLWDEKLSPIKRID